jgi:tetratricopeptide (TPR) repeat protein
VGAAPADGASQAPAAAASAVSDGGRLAAPAAGGEQQPGPAPVAADPGRDTGVGAAPRSTPTDALAASKGKNYERLVSDADRLLENGQTTRAQKLYDEALQLQPNGVAALTGSAFLQLDRQKPLAAISLFKRALARAPGYPPALFGMGEAYRAQGYTVLAIDYYKQYLATAPGGPDAHAARGQLKELEDAPQRRVDAPSPSAVIPPENIRPERRIEPAPVLPP